MRMVERISDILCVLVELCTETQAILAPTLLRSMAMLAEFVSSSILADCDSEYQPQDPSENSILYSVPAGNWQDQKILPST